MLQCCLQEVAIASTSTSAAAIAERAQRCVEGSSDVVMHDGAWCIGLTLADGSARTGHVEAAREGHVHRDARRRTSDSETEKKKRLLLAGETRRSVGCGICIVQPCAKLARRRPLLRH